MSEFGLLATYATLFAIAVAMPNWRYLKALGLLLGVPIVWAFFDVIGASASGAAALGQLAAIALILSAGFGLLSGVVTRAVTLMLLESAKPRVARVVVAFFGFLVVPCYTLGAVWSTEWATRLPSEACLESEFKINVAGLILHLPAAPLFSVLISQDGGSDPSEVDEYAFRSNADLRAVCNDTDDRSDPLHVLNLSIEFSFMKSSSDPKSEAFCRTPASLWGRHICQTTLESELPSYPIRAMVYSPVARQFNHRMAVNERGSHTRFLEEKANASAQSRPIEAERFGSFDRYANGYWVAHSDTWMNAAGEPYTYHCYDTGADGLLFCTTAYAFNGDTRVAYAFYTNPSDIEVTAHAVDQSLLGMILELSSGS